MKIGSGRAWGRGVLGIALLMSAACRGDSATEPPPPPPPDTFSGQVAASQTADIFVSDSSVVTMTVRNQNGQAAPGRSVFFAVTAGQATLSGGPPWTTDANGVATAVVRATNPGSVSVTGYLGTTASDPAQGQVALQFIADELTAAFSISDEGELRMSAEPTLTVRVVNQNNAPVTGQLVTFEVVGGNGVAGIEGGPSEQTDAQGEASVTLKALSPGTVEVRAWLGNVDTGTNLGEVTATFVIGPPAALRFVRQPRLTLAGIILPISPVVEVIDQDGFPVDDARINVTLSTEGGAPLAGTTTVLSSGAQATFPEIEVVDTRAGFELIATAQGLQEARSAPLTSMYRNSFQFVGTTACMPTTDGELYCWGGNRFGQAGSTAAVQQPVPVPATAQGQRFRAVATGNEHSCGVGFDDRRVWCWGTASRLGSPDALAAAPGQMVALDGTGRYDPMRVSEGASCGRVNDGALVGFLVCWGDNTHGQMGKGDRDPVRNTIAVSAITQLGSRWTDFDTGRFNGCAISEASGLYCWGSRRYGLVGDGVVDQASVATSPVLIGANDLWRSVSVSVSFACAVTLDNRLQCWGDAEGLNDIIEGGGGPVAEPTATLITDPVVAVDVGQDTACAAMADGRLLCWGSNIYDGSDEVPYLLTEAPATFSNFAIGRSLGCLVDAQGKPFCWGASDQGQRGDGTVGVPATRWSAVSGDLRVLTSPPPEG